MPLLALLDANALSTFDFRDVILRAAEQGICRVRWSEEILAERSGTWRGLSVATVILTVPRCAWAGGN
jgi:hypothetical protein